MDKIHLGSQVNLYYENDWYDEGTVVKIDKNRVFVDFADWIEQWYIDELKPTIMNYDLVFIPNCKGKRVTSF